MENAIKAIDPLVDLYHIHNEPDWPVWVTRKHTDKPIIYDIHDMRSVRGDIEENEEKALAACNAVSVVSRGYQEKVLKRRQVPIREVLSCVPKGLFPTEKPKIFRGGIVYEGGLGSGEFPCRNWAETFAKIQEMGIQVWAYPGNPGASHEYQKILIQPTKPYNVMIRELSMYEFGLVGSPSPDAMFDGALPNKLFEYIAAGIPIVNMNAPDIEKFLLATGLGVTVASVEEIPDAMQHMRDNNFRRRVWENRWYWTMETQAPKVQWLYECV